MQETIRRIEEKLKSSARDLDDVVAEAVSSTKNVQDLLPIAELLSRNNRYSEAKRVLLPIVETHPENGQALYLLGNAYVALNEINLAKECYIKAISLGNSVEKATAALALVEKALGNKRKAEQLLKEAGESKNASLLPKMMLYSLYMEQFRYDEARKTAAEICSVLPQSYLGHHSYLLSLFEAKKYEDAKQYLESACGSFGNLQEYVFDYVSTLLLLKKPADADVYWKSKANGLDASSLEFMRIEVQIASDLHDKERTLNANKKLYETYRIEDAAVSIATLYIIDRAFDKALRYLKPVIEEKRFTKAYFSALYLIAFCEEQVTPETAEESYREIIQIYEEAVKKNVVNTYVMSFAAECYKKIGDAENALRCESIVADFRRQQGV